MDAPPMQQLVQYETVAQEGSQGAHQCRNPESPAPPETMARDRSRGTSPVSTPTLHPSVHLTSLNDLEATGGTTLASNLVDTDSLVEHSPMAPREPRMMEPPKQTVETAKERSRDPLHCQSESHSEDGLGRIWDPARNEHSRFVKVIVKARAPQVMMDAPIEKCGKVECGVNAYHEYGRC